MHVYKMHISSMHVLMMHVSMMHVFMMRISLIDHDACVYDARMYVAWCMYAGCRYVHEACIYDACMWEACQKWGRTNGRTNRQLNSRSRMYCCNIPLEAEVLFIYGIWQISLPKSGLLVDMLFPKCRSRALSLVFKLGKIICVKTILPYLKTLLTIISTLVSAQFPQNQQ